MISSHLNRVHTPPAARYAAPAAKVRFGGDAASNPQTISEIIEIVTAIPDNIIHPEPFVYRGAKAVNFSVSGTNSCYRLRQPQPGSYMLANVLPTNPNVVLWNVVLNTREHTITMQNDRTELNDMPIVMKAWDKNVPLEQAFEKIIEQLAF